MAALDVSTHARSSWIVSKEGMGLDLALEAWSSARGVMT
jgi:hypothetical protein